jgi:arginase
MGFLALDTYCPGYYRLRGEFEGYVSVTEAKTKIQIFDIPTSAGCLERGTELLPQHFRKHGLLTKLQEREFEISDLGAVDLPDQPRHNTPPIRNYPLSKIVWSKTHEFIKRKVSASDSSLLLGLGGDCSVVVGSILGLSELHGAQNIHLLYLDGDVDSIAPDSAKCAGSAGMGLWFLTQESEYWPGKTLLPSQITVIGNKKSPETDIGIPFVTLDALRKNGIQETMDEVLKQIPDHTTLLVHFDVDILSESEMPAAYAPRAEGLSFEEAELLLRASLKDKRARYLEITEFMPQKDPNGLLARTLIETLARCI